MESINNNYNLTMLLTQCFTKKIILNTKTRIVKLYMYFDHTFGNDSQSEDQQGWCTSPNVKLQ